MKFTSFNVWNVFKSDKSSYKTFVVLCSYENTASSGQKYLVDRALIVKSKLQLVAEMDFEKLAGVLIEYNLWENNFWIIDIYIDEKQLSLINWVIQNNKQ